MLPLLLLGLCFLGSGVGQTQKLSNIDYIGLGYDVLVGNPHSDLYDPGKNYLYFDLKMFSKT